MNVLNKAVNRRIGQAMHKYNMLTDGDRVLVAVSGGVDSLVLTWLLKHWQRKAPISYEMHAVFIDNGFGNQMGNKVAGQLEKIDVSFRVEKTDFWQKAKMAEDGKSVCYHCARLRRNRLFSIAEQENFNKMAFGHHKDDIIETFFINLLYAGNLSTMVPNQKLFHGKLNIIRPLAFLEKEEIIQIADTFDIIPVKNPCPKDEDSKRREARKVAASLSALAPRVKANIFAALANIREGYLLDSPN
jgi:tRNA 2-thiocytidine biosynthesis protein TtcA